MKELFENIRLKHQNKIVTSLCKKLQEKCSFNSEKDIRNLNDLAFWIYIIGDLENAIKIIDETTNVSFNGKYNVWDYIHNLWMLKVRILRERGNLSEANKIIEKIIEHDLIPNEVFDTKEKKERLREKIINRTIYSEINCKEEIESSLIDNDIKEANNWRFIAIIKMIRYKEEGVYPDLIQKNQLIESDIYDYINILKNQ
ncbi:DUF6707 family protein [Flavobacterium sp. KACC 22763]|uniref:DUF6707 family protein n=1 Tax=Flavobacterium sp. KACC 22763 TaxID=3025668 RepID=UPI002365C012|nr:DUF6707 family protein [Flavobacterium sp. KACC 22763]WDF64196.1 hypothetical protein PQ463_21560 [Flavobacterium sp. KACC 22763]